MIELGGNYLMNKEEILAKSRKQGDEMEVQVKDKSFKWVLITMVALAALFAFIRAEQGYPMSDLTITVTGACFVGFIYRFIRTKDKFNLVLAMITLIGCIIGIYSFCIGK